MFTIHFGKFMYLWNIQFEAIHKIEGMFMFVDIFSFFYVKIECIKPMGSVGYMPKL